LTRREACVDSCTVLVKMESIGMNTNPPMLAPWQAQLLGVLRIVAGYLFLLHGCSKLLHVPHVAMFDDLELFSLIGLAGVIELVGGFLLLIGLFTRPVAFVLSGEMAAAYFMEHVPSGAPLVPLLNQGEAAVLYCFVFLYLAAAGPGAWSVDGALARRLRAPKTA
jgi:putative oxidoreductase